MHETPIRVDHVGIAVESVEAADPVLRALGCELLADEVSPDGSFRWVYYELGDASRLELVTPLEGESFLTDFLDRHGPGMHHVTLEVGDLDAVAETLEAEGLSVVDRADHDGYSEAFVSPRNPTGTLFQLMEYHEAYVERMGVGALIGGRPLSAEAAEANDAEPTVGEDVDPGQAERIAGDPFCATLGIELVELEAGAAETAVTVTEETLNFHGTAHGGLVYALADAAFAAASNAAGRTALALETNISYLKGVDAGTRLRATATETHSSGRTAEHQIAVETADGEQVATFRGRVYRP